MSRICLVALCVSLFSVDLLTQESSVKLLGQLYAPHGTSPQGNQFSACWGWTSPDGKEYALIGVYTGTSIIDLNSDTLKEVAFIEGPPAAYCYREIKTYRHYAYIVSEGGAGIQIVDLSGLPDTAVLVKNFLYTGLSGKNILRSHTLTLAGGYLYCNGSALWSPGGAVIFSLHNDPATPEYAGEYQPMYLHDSYVRNDTMYGAAIGSGGGLLIADLSDKSNPSTLAHIAYAGSGTHHAWTSIDGNYTFTTDEIGSSGFNLKVWEIQHLPSSSLVATYIASPTDRIHNVHGRGHYLYISHYKSGMRVVDVHDPANPAEAGFFDSYTPEPDPENNPFAGCWGVYPYFPSGRWIGSDMQTGLYLFSFDKLEPRRRVALLGPADSTEISTAGPLRWTSAANQEEDPHYYEIHILGTDLDTTIRTRDTILTIGQLSLLTPSQTYRWSVMTRDEFTEVPASDTLRFVMPEVVAAGERYIPVPFRLSQNYPNPFNPLTTITFTLDRSSPVTLKIFDVLGREVETILEWESLAAGVHEAVFDAGRLPSGVYFYRIHAFGLSVTKRMVLTK